MDGLSGIHPHMTNSLDTPVEALEYSYPVRIVRYTLRRVKGKFPGGDGIIREVRFLTPCQVTVLPLRRRFAPYGLQGGETGQPGRNLILRKDGTV
jgi:N-methylhydantoinase B